VSIPRQGTSSQENSAIPARLNEEKDVIREATVKDIERIETLTLEDFATDFSKVQIPDKEGPLADPEMDLAVDSFLGSLDRT
jgi:hypothetical protein